MKPDNPQKSPVSAASATIIAAVIGAIAVIAAAYISHSSGGEIATQSGQLQAQSKTQSAITRPIEEERAGAVPPERKLADPVAQSPVGERTLPEERLPIAEVTHAQSLPSNSEVTQTESPTGGTVKSGSWPSFETESYRLTVEDMKKSGMTVRVTMMLEAIDEGGLSFRARDWYLLDENGERWSEVERDPALVRRQRSGRDGGAAGTPPALLGVNLVSGTKIKDGLVFNATGSGQGTRFTLVGLESRPQSEREIILRGLIAKSN